MTLQIAALCVMVISFIVLVAWVYWPRNAQRMREASELPFPTKTEKEL